MRSPEALWWDLRVAVRVLKNSPGATALSVLSIALGIGLTTGLFSLADAAFFRPYPLERPGELFKVASRGDDGQEFMYGWLDCEDLAQAMQGSAELSAYQRRGVLVAGEEGSQPVFAWVVSPNHFSLLGGKAALGRASLDPVAGRPAVVLAHRLWLRRFGGDPGIVGKTVVFSQRAFTVTGVMPAEFTGLFRFAVDAVWVNVNAWFGELGNREERESRGGQFEVVARLKPGVTPERAAAQMDAAIRGAGKHKPAPAGAAGTTLTAEFALTWRQKLIVGSALLLLLGLVLFVGCANAAELRLAQAESRKRELGVRMALGASPWRLTRLLLVESALVSAAGAGLGILLAQFLMQKAGELVAVGMESLDPGVRLDYRVLSFTLVAALVSVLLAGLAPARHAVRLNMTEVLKSGQGVAGLGAGWQRRVLIAGQVIVSVLLFGLAAQFLQSLRNAAAIQPGMDPYKKMLVMDANPGRDWPHTTWCEQACERLSALPGVRGATFARRLPLSGSGGGLTVRVEMPGQAPLGVPLNNVGGNYFSLMGTRVVAGRGIDGNDRNGSPPVVVVSQQFVHEVFRGRDPLGEWIRVAGQPRLVVGVAADGPSNNLHEAPEPYLYLPYAQAPADDIALMVSTTGAPEALAQAVRRELKSFDPGVTLTSFRTLRQHMDQALSMDRAMAAVVTGLGVLSLLLTGAGLCGVIQYLVSQRTREIGLRVALGAPPGEIQRMVLAESLRMAAWGIPIGLAALGAAVWSVRSVVLGVTPANPLTYLASAGATVALALAAAWLPARRAAGVDPMEALRAE